MRILQVIPSFSVTSGGPFFAVQSMARAVSALGDGVDIAATDDDGRHKHLQRIPLGQWQCRDGYRVIQFPKQTEFYKISLPMRRWLRANMRGYDLLHTNALFSFAPAAAAFAAREHRVPYIVRPLGVLNQWGLRNRRRLIKTISFRLIEQRVLRAAAAIHCTSRDEAADVAKLGFGDKAVVLPLGVDLQPFQALPPAEVFFAKNPQLRGKQLLLFLSRINAKKGLDLLLPAFAQIAEKQPETRLVIAGDEGADASGHLAAMQQLARDLGIAEKVTWTGHLDGEDRLACLGAASVFVLPSYSENFGIALLEAMACGLPCIASDQVALAADAPHAVHVIPCAVPALAHAMSSLLADPALRAKWGENARAAALQSYSLEAMGRGLHDLYHRLISIPRE